MRILVAGDTHNNLPWIQTLAKLAERHGAEGVVQLGDFGLWPDTRHYKHTGKVRLNTGWIDAVADATERRGLWLRFIDGNHDAHPLALAAYPAADNGIVSLRPGVLEWATRGARWTWEGVRFGALGGAESIDKHLRTEGVSWWATERITPEDVERLGNDPLDVLLTHDAPQGVGVQEVDIWGRQVDRWRNSDKRDAESRASRNVIESVRRATAPKLLLHGHYHLRYQALMASPPTVVEGLAADIQHNGGSWGILDLPSLDFLDGNMLAMFAQEERPRIKAFERQRNERTTQLLLDPRFRENVFVYNEVEERWEMK